MEPKVVNVTLFGACIAAAGAVYGDGEGLPSTAKVIDYAEKLYDEVKARGIRLTDPLKAED